MCTPTRRPYKLLTRDALFDAVKGGSLNLYSDYVMASILALSPLDERVSFLATVVPERRASVTTLLVESGVDIGEG